MSQVQTSHITASTGAVAIGRNEGDRLVRCLESLRRQFETLVYVDSGSTDSSVENAKALGVEVVDLDMTVPFSAGRARNAGFERIRHDASDCEFVQFIDGDCELAEGWVAAATEALTLRPELAIVCGRRRERRPEASVYNQLCDLEWDTPIGDVRACGGDFLARRSALEQVGGFDPSFVAGEEPELCIRLRAAGWKIARIDAEMTLHDADMTRVAQWWSRAQRSGHAYAQTAAKHWSAGERAVRAPVRSTLFWAGVVPLGALLMSLAHPAWLAALPLAYALQIVRVAVRERSGGLAYSDALAYALSVVLQKLPQMQGMLRFATNHLRGVPARIIEYK